MKQEPDKRLGVWVTPKEFFEPLRQEFDLHIDTAASADNAMLPKFFDEQNSAFDQDWTGIRAWCNPPYGRKEIYRWVQRCATGGAAVVVGLLPARTDTQWFHDFIWDHSIHQPRPGVSLRLLKGRIKFSGMKDRGKFPSMVVIFNAP